MHQYIVFMVDSSPNDKGYKVVRCLPRCGIVAPGAFKTVELFTEILSEKMMNEFLKNNHIIKVNWRFLDNPPHPLDTPYNLVSLSFMNFDSTHFKQMYSFQFYNSTSPIELNMVLCTVLQLPQTEEELEKENELTASDLELLGEDFKNFNPRPSI